MALRNAFENVSTESRQVEEIGVLNSILAQLDDATTDTVLSVLKAVHTKLGTVGGTVALDAATLAALENITVTVANPPTNPETGLAKDTTLQAVLNQLDDATTDTVLSVLKAILTQLGAIGGTVNIGNFPAFWDVSDRGTRLLGHVTVDNFPTVQGVSGTIQVGNWPATWDISDRQTRLLGRVTVDNLPTQQQVTGTINVGNWPLTQPVSGTVNVGNFPQIQEIVGNVNITNSPFSNDVTDRPARQLGNVIVNNSLGVVNDTNRLPVDVGANLQVVAEFQSFVSQLNEPPGPLDANTEWVGQWEDLRDYASIVGVILTDAATTLEAQFTDDPNAATPVFTIQQSVPANISGRFIFAPAARYFRVRVVTGTTAQTFLRAELRYTFNPPTLAQLAVGAQTTDANLSALMTSHLKGRVMSGPSAGAWLPLGTDGTGALLAHDATLRARVGDTAAPAAGTVNARLEQIRALLDAEDFASQTTLAAVLAAVDGLEGSIGTQADADTALTVIGRLKRIITDLAAYEANRNTDADATNTNLTTLIGEVDNLEEAIGTLSDLDTANTVIGRLKRIITVLETEDFASQTTLDALLTAFNAEDFATNTKLEQVRTEFNTRLDSLINAGESDFKRLLKFEPRPGEEIRRLENEANAEVAPSPYAGLTSDYHGAAADGALETDPVWKVVRFYKDANNKITRVRFRTGVAWSNRTAGW